ncbi:MAG: hypothetical protein AB1689_14995 [Thermodesulfobacteriota bacterium]
MVGYVGLRLAARASGGPLGPIPGGRLAGPLAADQDPDWSFTDAIDTIQVEVAPDDPLSVTTWVIAHQGGLYVTADFLNPWKRWPHLAVADPRVRLRIGGEIYERTAVRVTDPREIEELRRAVADKYDVSPHGLAAKVEVWFFRMDARR